MLKAYKADMPYICWGEHCVGSVQLEYASDAFPLKLELGYWKHAQVEQRVEQYLYVALLMGDDLIESNCQI